MILTRRRRNSDNSWQGLVASRKVQALTPSMDKGASYAYGGRLFTANGAVQLRLPFRLGSTGSIIMRVVPAYASGDAGDLTLLNTRDAANTNYSLLLRSAFVTGRKWTAISKNGAAYNSVASSDVTFGALAPQVIIMRWDGSILRLSYNGTDTTPSVGEAAIDPQPCAYIGAANTGLTPFSGYIGPVAFCRDVVDAAAITAVNAGGGALGSDPIALAQYLLARGYTDSAVYPLNGDSRGYALGSGAVPVRSGHRLVFDGDSLTVGYPGTDADSYPAQLVAQLSGTVVRSTVANTGNRMSHILAAAAADVDQVYDGGKTDICAVWCGTNDLADARTPAAIYADLTTYCRARQAAGFKVIIVTVTPRVNGSNDDRLALNAAIRANAAGADAIADPCADGHFDAAGDVADAAFYVDQTHLTTAGYTIVAGIVKTAIERLL